LIDLWKLLMLGFAVIAAMISVVGLAVSHVSGRPFAELMRHSFRAMGTDLKGAPARLRRRVADTFARSRSR
jgi:hypothetical protein